MSGRPDSGCVFIRKWQKTDACIVIRNVCGNLKTGLEYRL
ncbi:hypothetical protein COPEUT_02025 [Coprococcus eutactus ATCC 27759]|nr:hypothetical protein COPEUT_02025 [Coprococcus eutactus ATCC 27759]